MSQTPPPSGSSSDSPAGSPPDSGADCPADTSADPSAAPSEGASPPLPSSAPPPPPPPLPPHPPAGRTRHGLALGLAVASVVPAVLGGASGAPAAAASSAATTAQPDAAESGATEPSATEPGAGPDAAWPDSAQPDAAELDAVQLDAVTENDRSGCDDPGARVPPIGIRVHGGPGTYASGGGYGTWFLDLTNTTDRMCRDVRPVLVLVDEERKLTAEQIQVMFCEPDRPDMEHRVRWKTSGVEHIGVIGGEDADTGEYGADGFGGFDGFTVPAGRTVTVPVKMAFTSDARPGRLTAGAAIARDPGARDGGAGRAGGTDEDDGTWGEVSGSYSFAIVGDGEKEGGVGARLRD